jgi:murein DD-endopeptidase MepM/ murein hydrolase activator NlpD
MNRVRLALLAGVLLALLSPPISAAAASRQATPAGNAGHAGSTVVALTSLPRVAFATAADVAFAAPGEGVIRIVTRVCGKAPTQAQWQGVAAANNITAPVYLVLIGQRVSVDCAATPTGSQPEPVDPPTSPVNPSAGAGSGWGNPAPGTCITSPYGWRQNPTGPGAYTHQGVDLGAGYGVPILAAHAGRVISAGWNYDGYGISVLVDDGDGTRTHYAHMSRTAVGSGQGVDLGDVLGYVGATGDVTGPHLHFEVWFGTGFGSQRDPVAVLREHGVSVGC